MPDQESALTKNPPLVSDKWQQGLRMLHRSTTCCVCPHCPSHNVLPSTEALWSHIESKHPDLVPADPTECTEFRLKSEREAALKSGRKPTTGSGLSKRAYEAPAASGALSGFGVSRLTLANRDDAATIDSLEANASNVEPRKKRVIGSGVSASVGSASPLHDGESRKSPPLTTSPAVEAGHEENDIPRPPVEKKLLWTPDTPRSAIDVSTPAKTRAARQKNLNKDHKHGGRGGPPSSPRHQHSLRAFPRSLAMNVAQSPPSPQPAVKEEERIIPQPSTKSISPEQLIPEVKGIYAGLVMVESKCIEVDNRTAAMTKADPRHETHLSGSQYQAMIALHKQLLQEHHDFFLASQHPSASPALRRLPTKYAMPARMWRHGIHSFLEILRHRLPGSLEHMISFIYLAYSMITLLFETVTAFKDTWVECLGDLGRYRMAVEDDDIYVREHWTGIARDWYSQASDTAPNTGRLYHHLAILARPDSPKQLFYYCKSLAVEMLFPAARDSILTLFDPVLAEDPKCIGWLMAPPFDNSFVKVHACLFKDQAVSRSAYSSILEKFLAGLDAHIGKVTSRFNTQGYQISIANAVACLGYTDKDAPLMQAMFPEDKSQGHVPVDSPHEVDPDMLSLMLYNGAAEIVLERNTDPNVLSFAHVTLVFILRIVSKSGKPGIFGAVGLKFPWAKLVSFLNALIVQYDIDTDFASLATSTGVQRFPTEEDSESPLPEDWAMRGLLWVANFYFPPTYIQIKEGTYEQDEGAKERERPSFILRRAKRCVWVARSLVEMVQEQGLDDIQSMTWNAESGRFEISQPRTSYDGQ